MQTYKKLSHNIKIIFLYLYHVTFPQKYFYACMWYFRRILLNKILLKTVQLYVFHYHFPPSRRVEICMALFFRANGDNFLFAIYTWELYNSSQHVRDQFEYERHQFFYSGVVYMNPDWVSISKRHFKLNSCLHGDWVQLRTERLQSMKISFRIQIRFRFMYQQSYFPGDFSTYTLKYVNKTSHFANNLYFGHNERRFHSEFIQEWNFDPSLHDSESTFHSGHSKGMNSRALHWILCARAFRITHVSIFSASQLRFLANRNLNWLVATSKLHKHRGTCYTAEWPYCPFATLWFRIECSIRNEKWNELDPEWVATQSGFM